MSKVLVEVGRNGVRTCFLQPKPPTWSSDPAPAALLTCFRAMLSPEHGRAEMAKGLGWGGHLKKKKSKEETLVFATPCYVLYKNYLSVTQNELRRPT